MSHSFVWYPPGGSAITFSRDATDYKLLLAYKGLAGLPLDHKTVRSPYVHGALRTNSDAKPRKVTVPILIMGEDLEELEARVNTLANALNGLGDDGVLQRVYEDGSTFNLYCVPDDEALQLGTSRQDRTGTMQAATITFYAADPFWYSGTPNIVYMGYATGNFIPFEIPWELPANLSSVPAVNAGSQETPVQILLTGPLTNPVITNTTTGESVTLILTMAAGSTFAIDTADDERTAIYTPSGGSATNGYPYLDVASVLWKLRPGTNSLTLSWSSASSGALASVQWVDKYVGV